VQAAMAGHSLFFTGSAGTGKSFTLRVLVEELKLLHGSDRVFVTASTGMAACNIRGSTLHSFAGIGLGNDTKENIVKAIMKTKRDKKKNWRKCAVLVVDEISMISGDIFSLVDYVGRQVRGNERPFGGIQLVLCGDFLQLPPVQAKEGFAFESPAWKKAIKMNIELKEVIRQKNQKFVAILNEIRLGRLSPHHRAILAQRAGVDLDIGDGIEPTRLYPHRKDVRKENMLRLAEIEGETHTYRAVDVGDKYSLASLQNSCQAPEQLQLKVGAQVMLLKNQNFNLGLVNGSRGIVVGFTEDPSLPNPHHDPAFLFPVVRFASGETVVSTHNWDLTMGEKVLARRTQIPLCLAWAISIHKSQGMSIERVVLSLARVFAYGQAYVALSRVTSLEGLSLTGLSDTTIKAHPKVLDFYCRMKDSSTVPTSTYVPGTEQERMEEEFALHELADEFTLDALEEEAFRELATSSQQDEEKDGLSSVASQPHSRSRSQPEVPLLDVEEAPDDGRTEWHVKESCTPPVSRSAPVKYEEPTPASAPSGLASAPEPHAADAPGRVFIDLT